MIQVIGISGSLRKGSSNEGLLRLAVVLAPPGMRVELYEGLGGLPHFNPDLDTEVPPEPVRAFRAVLSRADAVLISSPEYAHGVPGSLKNALDWLVSSGELMGLPVALLNASAQGGEFVQPQLAEILRTMSAEVSRQASLFSPSVRQKLDGRSATVDPEIASAIRASLEALEAAVRQATYDRPAVAAKPHGGD